MELLEILKNPKTTIVDVRTGSEYAGGHIGGAINIPLDEIPERLAEFKEMSGPIVLYCRSGARSANALAFLRANGVSDVYNAGGIGNISMLMMNAR